MDPKSVNPTTRTSRPVPAPIRRGVSELGGHLSSWRKLRQLTQAQLADRAGVSRGVVSRLERGDGGVSVENLLRVLRSLGLLELFPHAIDPYETELGRLRSEQRLPARVRPRNLSPPAPDPEGGPDG